MAGGAVREVGGRISRAFRTEASGGRVALAVVGTAAAASARDGAGMGRGPGGQ